MARKAERAPTKPKAPDLTAQRSANLLPLCGCAGCQPLELEFQADPVMLSFLKRALLKRGWTGVATPAEKSYQRFHSTWAAGLAERGAALAAERPEFGQKPKAAAVLLADDESDAIVVQSVLL